MLDIVFVQSPNLEHRTFCKGSVPEKHRRYWSHQFLKILNMESIGHVYLVVGAHPPEKLHRGTFYVFYYLPRPTTYYPLEHSPAQHTTATIFKTVWGDHPTGVNHLLKYTIHNQRLTMSLTKTKCRSPALGHWVSQRAVKAQPTRTCLFWRVSWLLCNLWVLWTLSKDPASVVWRAKTGYLASLNTPTFLLISHGIALAQAFPQAISFLWWRVVFTFITDVLHAVHCEIENIAQTIGSQIHCNPTGLEKGMTSRAHHQRAVQCEIENIAQPIVSEIHDNPTDSGKENHFSRTPPACYRARNQEYCLTNRVTNPWQSNWSGERKP